MNTDSLLKKTSMISMFVATVLSILLVVPITENFINDSKLYILFLSALAVLFLFILKTFKEKSVNLIVSPVSGALLFFGLATAGSTFFTSSYPVEGLLGMGGVYISAVIIALFGGSIIPKKSASKLLVVLTGTSIALILATILQMVGVGPAQLINKITGASLPTNMILNLASSPFIAIQIVAITLVGIITNIITKKKITNFFAISAPILVVGVGIYAWALLPGKETSLVTPSLTTSWSIMLDSIRNPRAALIGSGPSSYTNIYTAFKPIWMNNGQQWSAIYSQASNLPLTLLSTMGILGFATWIAFVFKMFSFKKNLLVKNKPLFYMIGFSIFLQLLFPINIVMLTVQAIIIAFLIANEKSHLPKLQLQALNFKVINTGNENEVESKLPKTTSLPLYLTASVSIVGVLAILYMIGRTFGANVLMFQSSQALAKNDLVKSYELQQKAMELNPYLDTIRIRYAATNVTAAIALSNKADLTDAEREQVSSLLQQAVREAQAATTLDPNDSNNWAGLAEIYKQMIDISKDAAQWSIQSYTTAIKTDPNNPLLRLSLASIFSQQKDYQQAVSILSQAINIKPDFPGTHYNLGLNLENLEAYTEARTSYQRTLALLDANSEEYTVVNKRLEALEKLMEEKGISLDPKQAQQAPTGGQAVDGQKVEENSNIQTPSITEQSLNNNAAVDETKSNDVNLNPSTDTKNQEGSGSNSDLGEML